MTERTTAMFERKLGFLRALGQRDEAWQYALLELHRSLDAQCYLTLLIALASLAVLLADDGEAEQALYLDNFFRYDQLFTYLDWLEVGLDAFEHTQDGYLEKMERRTRWEDEPAAAEEGRSIESTG